MQICFKTCGADCLRHPHKFECNLMTKSYSKYIIVGLAIIPALWIISRVVMLHLRPVTPGYQQQVIAKIEDWKLVDVQTKDRVWDELDSNKEISDEDWQTLVKAADEEPNAFDVLLIMMFSHHRIEDKYRSTILKWCERNMAQTNDVSAAVLGYFGYVRAGGADKDTWVNRLKARGSPYPEKIIEQDKLAEKVEKKLNANENQGHHSP
jgi:hypothetical protein